MELARQHLTLLLNALYDADLREITVEHPSDTVGTLCTIDLDAPEQSTVQVSLDRDEYATAKAEVARDHGDDVADELPEPQAYCNAYLAGGLLEPPNSDAIEQFFERNGSPDLTAGHAPVFAGFDTNLLAWRIADVLGLRAGHEATVNGFALATGVLDELDWEDKRSDTRALESAFGQSFAQLLNQPAGANREGRLGETYYRQLRDSRYADEITSETGDGAIIEAYETYKDESRKDVILFSNDRDFVEGARAHRIPAQRVELPTAVPRTLTGSWRQIATTLYVLTVLFGVLELPKVTLFGVWKGKSGLAWQRERLDVAPRSPKIEPTLERDGAILDAYNDLLDER
jgi:hypothetical protein